MKNFDEYFLAEGRNLIWVAFDKHHKVMGWELSERKLRKYDYITAESCYIGDDTLAKLKDRKNYFAKRYGKKIIAVAYPPSEYAPVMRTNPEDVRHGRTTAKICTFRAQIDALGILERAENKSEFINQAIRYYYMHYEQIHKERIDKVRKSERRVLSRKLTEQANRFARGI